MTKLYCYNTIRAFYNEVNNARDSKLFSGHTLGSQEVDNSDSPWYGTHTWEEANELLLGGDPKSAEMIRKSGQIKTPKRTNRNRPIPSANVYGYMPHIPNFVAGIPTDMITQRNIIQKQKVITIIVVGNVTSGWSGKSLAETNAKIVTAIRMIEAGGVRVSLKMLYASVSREGDEEIGALIKIKDAGRYLEIEKMAYAMVNPAFFRRHFFRFKETRPELTRSSWIGGYGVPMSKTRCEEMLKNENIKWHYLCKVETLQSHTPEQIKEMFEQGN